MKYLNYFLGFVILLVIWTITSNIVNPLFLPSPLLVMETFIKFVHSGFLLKSTISSFNRITSATFLSVLVSIPLGLLAVNFKFIDKMITPITNFMRMLPVTAFYPLLILWIGIGEQMKIGFLFFATFFYFFPTVLLTLRNINIEYIETGLTMGMNKLILTLKVLIPAALPNICSSFLMMYGIGWTYIIIGENINTVYGLGHLMNIGSARGRTDMVFIGLICIILIGLVVDVIGNLVIKKCFKWHFKNNLNSKDF